MTILFTPFKTALYLKFINYEHLLQQIEMLRLQRVERFARWMAANGAL